MKLKIVITLIVLIISYEYNFAQIWIKTDSLPVGIVESIAVNPKNGKILAGIYGAGIFKSDFNGTNWTNASTGLPDKLIKVIRYNNDGVAFAGLNGKGLFKSTDDGQSWTESNKGLTNKNILDIHISTDGKIYAGTWFYGSVFVSTDNGAEWTDMKLDNKDVHSVVTSKDGSVLAGTEYNGLYKTKDAGKNWKSVGFSSNNIYDMTGDNGGRLYLGAKDGFYYSTDNGDTWIQQNKGMGSNVVRAITYSKAGSLFCGTSSGIFRSLDFGMNWTEYNDGLESNNKNIFSITTGIDDIVYAGTALGIYKTQTADNVEEFISEDYSLSVFPIPFKDKVNFKITIEKSGFYTLSIYDIFGRKIHNLFEGYLSLGTQQFDWYPENSSIGSYYYRINNDKNTTQGMILYMP